MDDSEEEVEVVSYDDKRKPAARKEGGDDDGGTSNMTSFSSSNTNKKKRAREIESINDMHERVLSKMYKRYQNARDATRKMEVGEEKTAKIGELRVLKKYIDKMEHEMKDGTHVPRIKRNSIIDKNNIPTSQEVMDNILDEYEIFGDEE